MLTPFPGTVDFEKWEKSRRPTTPQKIDGMPITRHWLIPQTPAAEGVHAASDDVARRDPRAHAGRLGSVLQPAADLEARRSA